MDDTAARMRKQRQEPPAPKGITPAEMYAIMAVSRLEGEGRKVRPGDIAKCGQATPSAVSQTLKSLEEKGLITRQRDKGTAVRSRCTLPRRAVPSAHAAVSCMSR